MSEEFTLNPGEQIRRQGPAQHLMSNATGMGYNPVNGTLSITSQRILFRGYRPRSRYIAGGSFAAEYPISHVTNAEMVCMRVGWSNSHVLKLTFDHSGHEYFAVGDDDAWHMEVLAARPSAPNLPYTTLPSVRSGVEATGAERLRMVLYIFGGVMGCGVLGCLALYASSLLMK